LVVAQSVYIADDPSTERSIRNVYSVGLIDSHRERCASMFANSSGSASPAS
jgi:hypothetical protein